jgi:hypothetical protein
MGEMDEFQIKQLVDNGKMVQITLVENVNTEPISQKQMIRESVYKKLDKETKDQVMPLLNAILEAQPTIKIKTYQQTSINITMPKSRYKKLGQPQVGHILKIDIKDI